MSADGERKLTGFVLPGYLEMLNEIARLLGQPDFAKSLEADRARLILEALTWSRPCSSSTIWKGSPRRTSISSTPSSAVCRRAAKPSLPAGAARTSMRASSG